MKPAAAAQGGRGDKRQRGHNGASKARADALAKTNKKSVSLRDRLRFLTHLLKKVRFFERIKIERQIGQLHRKLQEAVEQGAAPEEVSEQQAVLEEWQRKLLYVRHFPAGEKYVSLLRQADSPEAQEAADIPP
ncbi:uncharacterized protein HaLaN_26183, partial [Haematococcus lacustris]